jgi:hypothetical protein
VKTNPITGLGRPKGFPENEAVRLLDSRQMEVFKFSAKRTYRLYPQEIFLVFIPCGPGFSVGIATGYGLDGPGIESRWGEIFRTCPDRPWGPLSLLYNGYRVFPGSRKRPGREANPSHLRVPRYKKSRAIPLLSLRAFVACKKGKTYLLSMLEAESTPGPYCGLKEYVNEKFQ